MNDTQKDYILVGVATGIISSLIASYLYDKWKDSNGKVKR